jgi:hypothetical protein
MTEDSSKPIAAMPHPTHQVDGRLMMSSSRQTPGRLANSLGSNKPFPEIIPRLLGGCLRSLYVSETPSNSRLLFRDKFLKPRIVADWVPDRIEPQERRSERKATRYLQQPFENGNRVIGVPQ